MEEWLSHLGTVTFVRGECPEQIDDISCGVCLCINAMAVCQGVAPCDYYNNQNLPALRDFIVAIIVRGFVGELASFCEAEETSATSAEIRDVPTTDVLSACYNAVKNPAYEGIAKALNYLAETSDEADMMVTSQYSDLRRNSRQSQAIPYGLSMRSITRDMLRSLHVEWRHGPRTKFVLPSPNMEVAKMMASTTSPIYRPQPGHTLTNIRALKAGS